MFHTIVFFIYFRGILVITLNIEFRPWLSALTHWSVSLYHVHRSSIIFNLLHFQSAIIVGIWWASSLPLFQISSFWFGYINHRPVSSFWFGDIDFNFYVYFHPCPFLWCPTTLNAKPYSTSLNPFPCSCTLNPIPWTHSHTPPVWRNENIHCLIQ